jgi:hypothetical protein
MRRSFILRKPGYSDPDRIDDLYHDGAIRKQHDAVGFARPPIRRIRRAENIAMSADHRGRKTAHQHQHHHHGHSAASGHETTGSDQTSTQRDPV